MENTQNTISQEYKLDFSNWIELSDLTDKLVIEEIETDLRKALNSNLLTEKDYSLLVNKLSRKLSKSNDLDLPYFDLLDGWEWSNEFRALERIAREDLKVVI